MKISTQLLLLFLMIFGTLYSSNGSKAIEIKKTYRDAEYFYLYEKYEDALESYKAILKLEPLNSNIHFKMGLCYLQFQEKNHFKDALYHFEFSVLNVNPDYKNSYRENKAPNVAWLYYGDALRLNYKFEKAIAAYEKYLKLEPKDQYYKSYILREIENCKVAPELIENEVYLKELKNTHDIEKRESIESCPVISSNEDMLVFAYGKENILPPYVQSISEFEDYSTDDIYFSKKENGQWQSSVNITEDLGTNGKALPTSISSEGDVLYIVQDDKDDGNIYESKYSEGRWLEIEKLNKNINTKSWETFASISGDNKTLYFSSDRKGGLGGFDIYKSEIQPDGDWGEAVNLGPSINTKYDEDTPNITRDGSLLYFSSQGHKNMGGYDIFKASIENDTWGHAENVGYPLNTPGNDLFVLTQHKDEIAFAPLNDDKLRTFHKRDDSGLFVVSTEKPLFKFNTKLLVADKPDFKLQNIVVDTSNTSITDLFITGNEIFFQSSLNAFSFKVSADETDTVMLSVAFSEEDKQKEVKELEAMLQWQPSKADLTTDLVTDDLAQTETNNTGSRKTAVVNSDVKEIYFSFDKSAVQSKFLEDVKEIYNAWLEDKTQSISVEGYADPFGPEAYNMKLSQRRADAVKKALIKMGMIEDKITSVGRGETSSNPDNYYNRKTVITFVK